MVGEAFGSLVETVTTRLKNTLGPTARRDPSVIFFFASVSSYETVHAKLRLWRMKFGTSRTKKREKQVGKTDVQSGAT